VKLRMIVGMSLLVLSACATPPKPRYYSLSPASRLPARAASAIPSYRVAIATATVPEVLDRAQIVLRAEPNRYEIADAERWLEPLPREISRAIIEEMAERLPAARVASDSQYAGQGADYRVLIDVLRFESVPGKATTLEAAWSIRSRTGARLHEAQSLLVEKPSAPGVEPLVAAHAQGLAALGQEIATAIAALAQMKR